MDKQIHQNCVESEDPSQKEARWGQAYRGREHREPAQRSNSGDSPDPKPLT